MDFGLVRVQSRVSEVFSNSLFVLFEPSGSLSGFVFSDFSMLWLCIKSLGWRISRKSEGRGEIGILVSLDT